MALESTDIFILVLEIAVIGFAVYIFFRFARTYYRNRKVSIKTPKLRGRNTLVDNRVGTCTIIGRTPAGLSKDILHLMDRDNFVYHIPYFKDEIYPEVPTQAAAGSMPGVWRVKGQHRTDIAQNAEKLMLENENKEFREKAKQAKIEKRIAINEAATLPEKMEEIIKEINKPRAPELKVMR